jgi:hypothetical protein
MKVGVSSIARSAERKKPDIIFNFI